MPRSRCRAAARSVRGRSTIHIKGLQALGAEITVDHGFIKARVDGRLKGAPCVRDGQRRRHREPADGRGTGRRHHRARERRDGAGDRRPGRMPGRDGRENRRRHPQDHVIEASRSCMAATMPCRRPHRDRHLPGRRGDHRRPRHGTARPDTLDAVLDKLARPGPSPPRRPHRPGHARQASARGQHPHRAAPAFPPTCRRSSWR